MADQTIKLESITAKPIGGEQFKARWGVNGNEYVVNSLSGSSQQDFQDLMVHVSEKRAAAVEQEVLPMEQRMRKRNTNLTILGNTMAEVQKWIGKCPTDKSPDDQKTNVDKWSDDAQKGLTMVGYTPSTGSYFKRDLDERYQKVKTKIDRLNNDGSQDSTRLQSLVDHRDQSYQTATTLMSSISDTRSNLIRNM